MKNNTLMTVIITLIVAGGGGYMFGKSSAGAVVDTKGVEDSVRMMKEQSASIKTMGEMMKSSGLMMQEMGVKYKDERAITTGKDLEVVGGKYMRDDEEASAENASMKQMMGN